MYLSFYCKGSKRVTQGFTVRRSWRPNRIAIYWPHSYGRQRCVFLVLQGCSTGGPEAQLSAGWWLSLLHLITNWSPKLHRGSWEPLRPGVAFPTNSCLRRLWSPTHQGLQGPPPPGFLYHCYIVIYTFIQHHNDTIIKTHEGRKTQEELRCRKKDAWRIKMQEGRHKKTSLEKYSPLILFVRFACERMLETERNLHILTPLLWPSRCVVLVLLMLGSTPSGLSEGPLGRVWLSLPHLVSSCLEVYWQLHRGFPRTPSVGCGLPYHISSLILWESAGNCPGGGVREPPRSGVAFLTTSGLYCLEFDWQLLWDPNSTELNNNSTPTRSPSWSLKSKV